MASLIIDNLDPQLYEALRVAADLNGRSMEEQACAILKNALEQNPSTSSLGRRIQKRFRSAGGVELDLPSR
ncbi:MULTISPECIES: FitA-like ribbon-helix-helix domain-containing protein [unclassified Pseudomonas]|uniref:FitA-like ribbon-helix-helix domain-containing protein n=1 Tax=unclassified Pseudomonas TaxID=196821 RepID=UPI0028934612|nr:MULTISPECIES: plasmid stabilization protein [unclassified Pseudomonas]